MGCSLLIGSGFNWYCLKYSLGKSDRPVPITTQNIVAVLHHINSPPAKLYFKWTPVQPCWGLSHRLQPLGGTVDYCCGWLALAMGAARGLAASTAKWVSGGSQLQVKLQTEEPPTRFASMDGKTPLDGLKASQIAQEARKVHFQSHSIQQHGMAQQPKREWCDTIEISC